MRRNKPEAARPSGFIFLYKKGSEYAIVVGWLQFAERTAAQDEIPGESEEQEMNQVLMLLMAVGAAVGGIDRIRGNKHGYGAKFEEGFLFLGPTALSMAGMICLAPVLADVLGKLVIPFYQKIGVDPAMFGCLLAIDMGGYQLAGELAADSLMGSYAGTVAAAIFGCTIVFTIPVGMGMICKEDRQFFARGIMYGLVTMPVGLLAGGAAAGIPLGVCIHQNLPVFVPALLLLAGLRRFPEKMIRGFCIFAEGIRGLITIGLILAAVEYMCGWNPVKGMAPLEEAMSVVSAIGIVMLGSLPAAEFLQRILKKPFTGLGRRWGVKPESMTGLLVGSVSVIPAISMYRNMDEKGKIINGAFMVSSASLLAAHMGFVISVEPEMLGALLAGKLSGAAAALALSLFMCRRAVTGHA